ncbi:MAG: bifunctional 4-hydroxy-3-methylbut-2-enyl diphosphate reductase/30S ribosomal protein S1 [Defluviitaleaceae bacterium]|nr:bifunctional 4-hydroxy-3-methylbut-2-enyl diphosphate reductase/30S ribosomal protein S1 [Defluviitaleaceae bacterium]
MKITVAKTAGFCAGVAQAVNTVYEELEKNPTAKLATLGQLVHNSNLTDDLATKGVRIINDLDEIKDETIIIRAHGITKETEAELKRRNIPYIDRTCPCVKAVHRRAAEGQQLIILGEATHPEVIGTASYGKDVIIAKNEDELLPQLNQDEKYTLVAQTTFDTESFTRITASLDGLDIEIHNTICNATSIRQKEAAELAADSDTMIVIGDKGSANTQALYEISRNICSKTIFIASVHDLLLQYLKPGDKIGVTAGASTPPALTKEAVQLMSEFANAVPEETKDEITTPEMVTETPVTEPQAQTQPQPAGQSFEEMLDESFKPLHSGRIVKGTVIRVTPTEVTVDLGYKSDGIITRQEFTDDPTVELTEATKPGDEFDVFIIRVNDGDGNILASKKKLDNQQNIKLLEAALEEKTVVTGKITDVIKGGLLANIHGCRVFVPSSQVSNRFVEDLTQFKGQEMRLHMLEIDRSKRRYVAGRKELAAQEAREIRSEMYAKLEEGQRLEGTVSRIVDFGAFVDIGGIDGLIHVSEMAWKRVRKVTDVLAVGDKVTVTVISVDKDKNKISLSLKDISNDPWNGIAEKYPVGSIVDGQVVRLATFGAFVSLEDGIDGLVHISQIANRHIAKADEVLKVGQVIQVKITSVDQEAHRINLSKREADLDLGYEVYDDEEYYEDEEILEEDIPEAVEEVEEPAVEVESATEETPTE